jgi:hypothetical protein
MVRRLGVVFAFAALSACGGGGGSGGSSGGGSSVAVPNVVGDTQAAAATAITAAGLTVGTVTMQSSGTVTSGNIISENPAAGVSVTKGSAVALAVSSGPAMVTVPNVVGDSQAAATTAITGAGLTLGMVTMQSSATVASGSVISENPAAGTSVASGSPVALAVSTGAAVSTPALGGVVIGLSSGVTVQVLNGADNLPVTANGPFTFPTNLMSGATYSVSVGAPQPTGQTCAVQNAAGTAGSANITNVVVYCTFNVTAATLTGTYDFAGYNINLVKDGLFTETFDGAGNRSGTGTTNINTTIATGVADSGTYVIAANAAQIPVLTDSGNNIGGILGADGDVFVWLANTSNGQQPAMAVGVKPLTTATIASLTGTYLGASMTSASPLYGSLGTTTVNSDGSASQTGTNLSASGVPSTTSNSYPAGTFVVGSGGAISVGGSGGASGYLSADGNIVVLTYITGTNNFPGLSVAIKQSGGLTAATLNGVYAVVALGGTAPSASFGLVQTVYAHGDGTYTVDYTQNAAGTVTTATATGTYTVSDAGALVVTTQGGVSSSGQISADGNAIVLGNISSGQSPAMAVGVRQ